MFKRIRMSLAVLGTLIAGYLLFIRPWYRRWGTTDAELKQPMPGDDQVTQPNHQATHAVTITARPEQIWLWLVQMGQGRGGLYSYAWLENMAGLQFKNADQIIPEYQHLEVGDIIAAEPGGSGFRVAAIDPNRSLILVIRDMDPGERGRLDEIELATLNRPGSVALTWVFLLQPLDQEHTRLIVRWQARYSLKWPRDREDLRAAPLLLLMDAFIDPIEFLMTRKMLLGIKQRAERTPIEKLAR